MKPITLTAKAGAVLAAVGILAGIVLTSLDRNWTALAWVLVSGAIAGAAFSWQRQYDASDRLNRYLIGHICSLRMREGVGLTQTTSEMLEYIARRAAEDNGLDPDDLPSRLPVPTATLPDAPGVPSKWRWEK